MNENPARLRLEMFRPVQVARAAVPPRGAAEALVTIQRDLPQAVQHGLREPPDLT
jgi:hypothetical protein